MKPWISFLFYHPFASKFVSSLKALEKREIVVILSATWPCHCTLIRLWERDFYLAIAEEGAARVNYHTIEMESEYKSTSRWKLYLSPLHRHFAIENTAAVIILLTRLLCHIVSAAVSWDPRSASPKETAAHNRTHSFPFAFVVYLHFVEQTNHIIAKCEWRMILREKACGANNEGFLAFVARRTRATGNGLCSWATSVTNENKCLNEIPKYKWFICSSLCSANERI